LSARAAECLAAGPLDAVSLMRDVCQVARLQPDAAERMALALLSSHDEFVLLPSGHWALREPPLEAGIPARRGTAMPAAGDDPLASGAERVGLLGVDFAVVDVETTGTRVADRVTEIAIARVSGGELQDVYTQLVNPQRPIPAHISALTHITWAMVKDQPPFGQIAPDVVRRLAGHVFTAHNAAFDWRFVSNELTRGGLRLSGPRLCTVRLARLLLPRLTRRSLDHVTRYFGIEISARHRAAGDAEATARALVRMLRIAEGEGVSSWQALEARLATAPVRRRRSAADRRRRAFPHPVIEDHIA
jgi:DNA polymerase-3 subunit epsilon